MIETNIELEELCALHAGCYATKTELYKGKRCQFFPGHKEDFLNIGHKY